MKKKILTFFVTLFLFQNKLLYSQGDNAIIISVGDYPITKYDLLMK